MMSCFSSCRFRQWLYIAFAVLCSPLVFTPGAFAQKKTAKPAKSSAPTFPAMTNGYGVADGVLRYEVRFKDRGLPQRIWVYMPEAKSAEKRGCVVIAPAGTPLIYGNSLGEGEDKEHLPYVKSGFVVVAYDIAGPVSSEKPSDPELMEAMIAYKKAGGGVTNAKAAIDYALARVPNIDTKRIYTAGHSSAATLALMVAAKDPRVKGCIAYAPACYVGTRLGSALPSLDKLVPGFSQFIYENSPDAVTDAIKCPVFLFSAADDTNVPLREVKSFADNLRSAGNTNVTFDTTPSGGHYQSMIDAGIPSALQWLKKQSQ